MSQPKGSIFKEYMNLAYLRQARLPRYLAPSPLSMLKGAGPGVAIGLVWVWFKHYGNDPTAGAVTGWYAKNVWPANHLDNLDELEVVVGRITFGNIAEEPYVTKP